MSETVPAPSAVAPPAAAPAAPAAAPPLGKVAYRRLPGRVPVLRIGLVSSPGGRLYFGPDHLLKIDTGAIYETYKRFAFREITGINLVRTARWHWLTGICGAFAFIWGLSAIGAWFQGTGQLWAFFAVLTILCLVAATMNLLRGPTCLVTLHTALGPELLPTLGRLRVAVPVVREIAAAAEQAQGKLDAEAVAARIATSLPPG